MLDIELQKLGLQEHEAKVYLACLELGQASVTQISKTAGLNRTTGYDVLERLTKYGIVSRTGVKKKTYIAESPSKLKMFLKDQKRVYEKRIQMLDDLLPELGSIFKTDLKPVIKFAEGRKEMEKLYLGVLESKTTVYSILNLQGYAEVFDEMGTFQTIERTKRKIKEKVLAFKNETAEKWHEKTYKKSKGKQLYTDYRWLDIKKTYTTAGEVNIFDDRVIGILSSPKENVAFEIKSQSFTNFLKVIFEIAWSASKPIGNKARIKKKK